MKFFKHLIVLPILFSLSCQTNSEAAKSFYDEIVKADDTECEKEKLKLTAVIAELAKLRTPDNESLSEDDKNKIFRLVENFKSKEDLIAVAKITMLLKRHSTSDECFKNNLQYVYDHAFWRAVEKLAEDRSEENMKEMKRLKEEIGIDGADGYDWLTIVERIPAP
jgi:hypothetical protein